MHTTFEGKVALVTGAAGGIGLATAKAFALAGASVVLADQNEKLLNEAAEKMRESANRAYRLKLTGQRQSAVDLVRSAGLGLLDIRDKVNDADVEIRKVANKFVKAARVAPL